MTLSSLTSEQVDMAPHAGAQSISLAAAWRSQPKWVVSRSLKSVGPNATLVEDDGEAVIRGLKAQLLGRFKLADQTWHESRQAILRWPPAAAPPCGQRFNRRGRDQVDVRSYRSKNVIAPSPEP